MTCAYAWALFMGFLFPFLLMEMLFFTILIALISTEPKADQWQRLFGIKRDRLSVLGSLLLLVLTGVCGGASAFGWESYRDMACDSASVRVYERGVPKT